MINTEITKSFWDNNVESYLFLLEEDFSSKKDFSSGEDFSKVEEYYPNLKETLLKHQFTGKAGQSFNLTATKDKKLIMFIFVGLGKKTNKWDVNLEKVRRAVGVAISIIKKLKLKTAVISTTSSEWVGVDASEILKHTVITAHMASYDFLMFKSKKEEIFEPTLYIYSPEAHDNKLANEGAIIGQSVNLARTWKDLPPNILTPEKLRDHAEEVAKKSNLKFTSFGRDKAEKLGMGGFCAVDEGSEKAGQFIILEYNYKKDAPIIALVGKGVTFDSGGISLKPSNYMSGMKYDMSGAASVIATMNAVGQLKPNVNVVAIAPAVENMPSGRSSRQDDVITFMNGKTAEIISTDAEGRLILADALCYAEKFYKPDMMIDMATLTGACVVALGHYFSALMTVDETLEKKLIKSGKISGDRLWPLPFDDDYKPGNKSNIADISNCGSKEYSAGTITAGLFLSNFVEKTPWAHIDIAGTSDQIPAISYLGNGATGVGVRLFIEFIRNFTL